MNSICFVVNKYPNEYEPYMLVFLQQLAWEIADQGKKVSVICPLQVNLNRKYIKIPYHSIEKTHKGNRIDVFWPKTFGLGQSHYILGKSPVGITTFFLEKAARKVIKKEKLKYDVLYGHFLAPSGIVAARLGRIFNKPAFFALGESHDTISQFGAEKAKKELKRIAGVIAVSTALKNWIINRGVVNEKKVVVLPNGINKDRFIKHDKKEARKIFGFPQDDILVAFVGAFNERKGVLRVCKAMEKVNGAKLICAGKGDQNPFGKNCIFADALSPEEIPYFYSSADIFILPTLNEGCSNAIVEAMACGLPIISSNKSFNDDILGEEYSFKINPESIDEIAMAIEKLVSNPKLREDMSEKALIKSREFTLDVRARNIISFIDYSTKSMRNKINENKDWDREARI